MLNFIEQEFQLDGKNIDPRYFVKSDNGYKATPLLKYIIARDAKKFFRKIIDKTDNGTYVALKKEAPLTKLVKDDWASKQEKEKYPKEFEEIDRRYAEYRESHLDEFYLVTSINYGGEDEARFIHGYIPEVSCSLPDAIMGYNAAKEMEQKYGTKSDNYDEIPRGKPYYKVKKEFEDQHRLMKESWYPEVGLPKPETFKKQKEVENTTFNWRLAKDAGINEEIVSKYGIGLIEYITHNTKEEFLKTREEMNTLIHEDIDVLFNETSIFKAEKDERGKIQIFTVPVDFETGEIMDETYFTPSGSYKFIEIEPEEDSMDNYEYRFKIVLEKEQISYKKTINTKADLRKAIQNSISMVEDIDSFKKYADKLNDMLDKL